MRTRNSNQVERENTFNETVRSEGALTLPARTGEAELTPEQLAGVFGGDAIENPFTRMAVAIVQGGDSLSTKAPGTVGGTISGCVK